MVDLSIIVPVYNTAIDKLEACFGYINDFVSKSSGLTLECLIIDDGSQEEISKWCKQFAAQSSVYRFYKKQNEGVSVARNLGIDLAEGNYITFVDSDDFLLPYSNLNSLLTSQDYDVVFSHLATNRDQTSLWRAFEGSSRSLEVEQVLTRIVDDGTLNGPVCKLIRRDFLNRHQIQFDRTLITGEDLVFLIEILKSTPKIYYINECTYIYNIDVGTSNSRLQTRTEVFLDNNLIMYQKMLDLIAESANENQKLLLGIKATERYIKQLFNSGAELLEMGSLSEEIKEKLLFLISLIDSSFTDHIVEQKCSKSAIQLRILSKKQWWLLFLSSKLRLLYLNLKKR